MLDQNVVSCAHPAFLDERIRSRVTLRYIGCSQSSGTYMEGWKAHSKHCHVFNGLVPKWFALLVYPEL